MLSKAFYGLYHTYWSGLLDGINVTAVILLQVVNSMISPPCNTWYDNDSAPRAALTWILFTNKVCFITYTYVYSCCLMQTLHLNNEPLVWFKGRLNSSDLSHILLIIFYFLAVYVNCILDISIFQSVTKKIFKSKVIF